MERPGRLLSRVRRASSPGAQIELLRRTLEDGSVELLSTDVFDTVLLRDRSTEAQRLAQAAHRASRTLGVDPRALARLRWDAHVEAYRAVAMERPSGDASLTTVWSAVATSLGLGGRAVVELERAEVEVDAEHLRANTPLLAVYDRVRAQGIPVVAVSDTYYSEEALRYLLHEVVGSVPFDRVWSSSDAGATKHRGGIFPVVAAERGVHPSRILHVGDDLRADVERAAAAGWRTHHLPRGRGHRASKVAGRALGLAAAVRRAR